MAFALEAMPNPVQAAQFAGLTQDPKHALVLAKAARELYPQGVGKAALSGMGKAVMGLMMQTLWENVAHLKPDFIAGGAKAVGQLLSNLDSANETPASAEYVFTLTGASGESVSLIRDPAKVMRPKLPEDK